MDRPHRSGAATLEPGGPVSAGHGEAIAALVEQMLDGYGEYFPEAASRPTIDGIALRTRRQSAVARVRLAIDGDPRGMYVKIHKKAGASHHHQRAKVLNEFDTLQMLHAGFGAVPGFGVARPIAVFPDLLALVTEEAEGENLHQLIRQDARGCS